MKNLKRDILITLLFMTIGIAAVTGNLLISGSTELAANTDDFDVYFSDPTSEKADTFVSINNSKSFTIKTELKELNEEDKVNFKVTNASQNYDAEVSIDCTSESVYLKATPHLSSNIIPAREEIDGSVSIKLVRQSIEYKNNQKITCTINASAVERNSLSTGIEYNEKLVMLKNYTARDDTGFSGYIYNIRTITFEEEINIPDNAIETWDFGVAENGNVMAYIVDNEDDGYDLYIQSDEQLYGNPDMSYWFNDFYGLETINNLDLLDTSKVTNMYELFWGAGSLQTLDLSSWDTSNVTNMSYMFDDCSNLTTFIGLENFDTSNVTDMSGMFYMVQSIESINLSSWDTSNVTDMNSMFGECSSLTTIIGLENFDTSNVTDMSGMFYVAQSLESINLSSWDTSNVTDMNGMFKECSSLTTIIGLENFDTSIVTDMSYMFYRAGYDNPDFNIDLSNLDTSSATNMSYMFYYMGYNSTKLNTSITIRNPNVTSYSNMFKNVATKSGTSFTVNYISETSTLVDNMIATKSEGANVVKGTLVN